LSISQVERKLNVTPLMETQDLKRPVSAIMSLNLSNPMRRHTATPYATGSLLPTSSTPPQQNTPATAPTTTTTKNKPFPPVPASKSPLNQTVGNPTPYVTPHTPLPTPTPTTEPVQTKTPLPPQNQNMSPQQSHSPQPSSVDLNPHVHPNSNSSPLSLSQPDRMNNQGFVYGNQQQPPSPMMHSGYGGSPISYTQHYPSHSVVPAPFMYGQQQPPSFQHPSHPMPPNYAPAAPNPNPPMHPGGYPSMVHGHGGYQHQGNVSPQNVTPPPYPSPYYSPHP
jgi:hypothetical protein